MAIVCSNSIQLQKELVETLGLKDVVSLDFHFNRHEQPTLTVSFVPRGDDLGKLVAVLKKYRLVEEPL